MEKRTGLMRDACTSPRRNHSASRALSAHLAANFVRMIYARATAYITDYGLPSCLRIHENLVFFFLILINNLLQFKNLVYAVARELCAFEIRYFRY